MTSLKTDLLRTLEERLGILRAMRMVLAGVNVQSPELIVARAVRREHSANGFFDEALGVLGLNLARRLHPQSAGKAAVAIIEFLVELLAAEFDFLRVDDDDEIAVVDVRSPGRLVFA